MLLADETFRDPLVAWPIFKALIQIMGPAVTGVGWGAGGSGIRGPGEHVISLLSSDLGR